MTPEHRAKLHSVIDKELARSRHQAVRELGKMKKSVDRTVRQIEQFVEENPEKVALISAGIGAALGAATALFIKGKKKRRK